MLTDKTKNDFEKYFIIKIRHREDIGERYFDENLLDSLYTADLTLQLAYALDFFDTKGIFIYIDSIQSQDNRGWRFHIHQVGLDNVRENEYGSSREYITIKAIEKANEIYNSTK